MHTYATIALLVAVHMVVSAASASAPAGGAGGAESAITIVSTEKVKAPAAEQAVVVPYLAAAPKMDADISEWKDVKSLALGADGDRVRGKAWLGWDTDRLYLACEIVDPDFRNTGIGPTADQQNCVIFSFKATPESGRAKAERMTFAMTRRGAVTTWDILHRDKPGACVIKQVAPDRWVYEIALSWKDMKPISPVLCEQFGFDVAYQYLADGRRRSVRWQKSAAPAAGRGRRRRGRATRYGPAVLAPMPAKPARTGLRCNPSSTAMPRRGAFEWPVLLTLAEPLDGGRLTVEITGGEGFQAVSAEQAISAAAGAHTYKVRWLAKGAAVGTYPIRATLKDAAGAELAADSFEASKSPAASIRREYDELVVLYDKLRKSDNAFYRKDAASVDVRMQTLEGYANRRPNSGQLRQLKRIIPRTREILQAMLDGKDFYKEARGYMIRGFRSPYDDTLQFYEVFVPKDYDPAKKYPLMVFLHGAGSNVLATMDLTYTAKYFPDPEWQYIRIVPFARGRSSYNGLGHTEVLDTIAYTKGLYNIDDDRVYVKGFSMGGAGTWKFALTYPDIFAAANPRAGFVGYELYDRLKAGGERDWKTAVGMAREPRFHIENAANLPLFLYHGGSDPVIPVENTYQMWNALRELGCVAGLFIYEHYEHVWAMDMEISADRFLLKYKRNRFPDRISYRTAHLHGHRAYWVSIERRGDPMEMSEIDCLKQSDGSIIVKERNVAAFSLDLCKEVVAGDRLNLSVNGKEVHKGAVPKDRTIFLEKRDGAWSVGQRPKLSDLVKQPGLSGPMSDAFFGRVLYVYGTQGGKELTAELKKIAHERTGQLDRNPYGTWKRHGVYPFKADSDVTEKDIADSHLVLIGGPDENLITRKIAASLPIKFEQGSFTFGGRKYDQAADGIKFIYPSKLSVGRYVVVTAANSADGYRATSDMRGRIPDWLITGQTQRGGFFDNKWQVTPPEAKTAP